MKKRMRNREIGDTGRFGNEGTVDWNLNLDWDWILETGCDRIMHRLYHAQWPWIHCVGGFEGSK